MLHKSTIGCCCVFGSLCEIRNSDLDAAEKCCQPQVGQSDVHLRCDNRNEIWTGCPANMRTETCILTHIVHNTYSWKFKLTHSRDKRVNKISRSRSALGIMKYRRRSACDCQTNSIRTTTGRHLYRLPYLRVNNKIIQFQSNCWISLHFRSILLSHFAKLLCHHQHNHWLFCLYIGRTERWTCFWAMRATNISMYIWLCAEVNGPPRVTPLVKNVCKHFLLFGEYRY